MMLHPPRSRLSSGDSAAESPAVELRLCLSLQLPRDLPIELDSR